MALFDGDDMIKFQIQGMNVLDVRIIWKTLCGLVWHETFLRQHFLSIWYSNSKCES